MQPSWTDDEPGWRQLRETLGVARERARARWLVVLSIALLSTAAVVAWRVRNPRRFEASIVVRLTESEFDTASAPPPSGEITHFVEDVVLTRTTKLSLIEEHHLYPERMGPDPSFALDALSEDLSFRVGENYFAPEHYMPNQLGSARIVLTYAGRSPEESLAVVRSLGERIAREQLRQRTSRSERAYRWSQVAKNALSVRLLRARRSLAELDAVAAEDPADLVRRMHYQKEIKATEDQLGRLTGRAGRLALRDRLEAQNMGMRFALVDNGARPEVWLTERAHLALVGAIAFGFLLPMTMLAVGILGARIHSMQALRSLGIPVLGELSWRVGRPRPHRFRARRRS